MTITLHLSAVVERKLEALATQSGQDIETFIHDLLETVSGVTKELEAEHDTPAQTPQVVMEGGIHVVYAEATGDLNDSVRDVREERLNHSPYAAELSRQLPRWPGI